MKKQDYRQLVAKYCNFSVQYNIAAASAIIEFLKRSDDKLYSAEPGWAQTALLASLFAGTIIGMFVMGCLGDILGRRPSMLITLSLVAVGVLGCTAMFGTSADEVYGIYTLFRCVAGIGIGGIYPLAAASSAEAASDEENQTPEERRMETTSRVGWSFFYQQPGAFAPYLVALMLLSVFGQQDLVTQSRVVLVVGLIPAVIPIVLTYRSSDEERPSKQTSPAQPVEMLTLPENSSENAGGDDELHSISWAYYQEEWPRLVRACFGCALSWFLYDVSYYGTAVFTPVILSSIFPDGDLLDNAWHSTVVILFSVPGTAVGVWTCKRFGCWWTGLTGFLAMAAGFLILGILMDLGDRVNNYVKLIFFIILSMLTAAGPAVSTYVTPALIFPTKVRTTFHGIAAASAKFGALAGTIMYPLISDATSVSFVLFLQVGFSLIGAASVLLLPRVDDVIKGYGNPHSCWGCGGGKRTARTSDMR